jgi:hypothetical protein
LEEQTASILRIGTIPSERYMFFLPLGKLASPSLAKIRSNKKQCNAFRKYHKYVYNTVKETHPRNKISLKQINNSELFT